MLQEGRYREGIIRKMSLDEAIKVLEEIPSNVSLSERAKEDVKGFLEVYPKYVDLSKVVVFGKDSGHTGIAYIIGKAKEDENIEITLRGGYERWESGYLSMIFVYGGRDAMFQIGKQTIIQKFLNRFGIQSLREWCMGYNSAQPNFPLTKRKKKYGAIIGPSDEEIELKIKDKRVEEISKRFYQENSKI